MSDLRALAAKFPERTIKSNPSGGGVYVPHPYYSQRLLMHLGAYDFTLVEVIRGDVAGKPPNPNGESQRAKDGTPDLEGVIVGAVMRLTVTIDGRQVTVEDVGDCEQPHNWSTDGARLKDAISDALKRCCRHIGLGLHLYAKTPDDYVLYRVLTEKEQADEGADTHEPKPPAPVDDDPEGRPFDPPEAA